MRQKILSFIGALFLVGLTLFAALLAAIFAN